MAGKSDKTILDRTEEIFVGVMILFACFVLFLNVVLRSMGYSMKWAEEFTRYTIVWLTFIGASICVRTNAHVGIDAFMSARSEKTQAIVKVVVNCIGIVFSLVLFVLGIEMVMQALRFNQKTAAMMISMAIPYAGIPLGCGLMAVRYVQETCRSFAAVRAMKANGGKNR
jgi:C4-dicarboxylate transporter DctQ subunit